MPILPQVNPCRFLYEKKQICKKNKKTTTRLYIFNAYGKEREREAHETTAPNPEHGDANKKFRVMLITVISSEGSDLKIHFHGVQKKASIS